jgi:hypothetical protein
MSKPRIRKVWLPTEMKVAIEEYCWQNRTKVSPFIVGIIGEFMDDPASLAGVSVPPAGKDYASVYVSDDIWLRAMEQAEKMGTRLSAVVRARANQVLAEAGITWSTETARPKNETIPSG